eukprot:m.221469 g.221469  ORF g.221469 m.221469 type:complete len:218 (+) comp25803_c0_seq5:54-707(+)
MAAAAAPTEGGAARSQKQKICGCGKKWCGQNEVVSDQSGSLCWDYSDVVAGANASCFTVGFGAHVMADPNTPRDSTSSGDFAGKRYTSVCFKLPGAVAARRFAKALAANRPIQVGEAVDVVLSPPTKRQNGKSTATKAPKRTKRVPGVVCAVFGDVVEVDVSCTRCCAPSTTLQRGAQSFVRRVCVRRKWSAASSRESNGKMFSGTVWAWFHCVTTT